MQLDTTRFGTIEIEDGKVITFTQPILGFQDHRRFVVLPGPGASLRWLQSIDSGDLAFLLMDPRTVMPDYKVQLGQQELAELAVTGIEELDVYTLVVVPQDPAKIRTNLKAPVLINPKLRLGKQTILDRSNYPIQFFLAQTKRAGTEAEEVPNARSNA